jgi:hypothetical protein
MVSKHGCGRARTSLKLIPGRSMEQSNGNLFRFPFRIVLGTPWSGLSVDSVSDVDSLVFQWHSSVLKLVPLTIMTWKKAKRHPLVLELAARMLALAYHFESPNKHVFVRRPKRSPGPMKKHFAYETSFSTKAKRFEGYSVWSVVCEPCSVGFCCWSLLLKTKASLTASIV